MAFSAVLFDIVSSQMTHGSALPQKMFNYTRGFSLNKSLSDRWAATLTTQIVILLSGDGTVFTFLTLTMRREFQLDSQQPVRNSQLGRRLKEQTHALSSVNFYMRSYEALEIPLVRYFCVLIRKLWKNLILRLYTSSANNSICKHNFNMKLTWKIIHCKRTQTLRHEVY